MADDKSFKELIAEQKKTNKLLEAQARSDAEGANLKASIKNSAGEIINDRLIGQTAKQESDQTQVKVSGVTSATYEVSEEQNEDSTTQERHEELVAAVNESGEGDADFLSPSQIKEQNKDKEKSLAKAIGIGCLKGMGGLLAGLKKLNPLKGNVGSFLSTLLKLGAGGIALIALKNFLESDNWKNMKENMIPALVRIFNFLSKIFKSVVFRFDKLITDLLDPEKSMTQVIKDNATTILGFVAAFYARTILAFGAALTLGMVGIGKYAGFGAFVRSVLFGKQKGKGFGAGAKGVAKRLGIVGVVITLIEAIVNGLMNGLKEESDPTKITSKFGGGISTIPAFLMAGLYTTFRDLALFGIGLISPQLKEELKIKLKANPEDDQTLIQNLADSFDNFYDSLLLVIDPLIALNNYMVEKLKGFLRIFGLDLDTPEQQEDKRLLANAEDSQKLAKANEKIENYEKILLGDHATSEEKALNKQGILSERDKKDRTYLKLIEKRNKIQEKINKRNNKALDNGTIDGVTSGGDNRVPVIPVNGVMLPLATKSEAVKLDKLLDKVLKVEKLPTANSISAGGSQIMGQGNPVTINNTKIVDAKNQSTNQSTTSVIRASVESNPYFQSQASWAI